MKLLTAIVLTKNEELHIRRCIENLLPICEQIFIIDCFSSDNTMSICEEYPQVSVYQHEWPGNQALQFNWALDHLCITTEWIIRLDADEYLLPGEDRKLTERLEHIQSNENAMSLVLSRYFLGRHMKHGGTNNIHLVRVFKKNMGRCEVRAMDECIVISEGKVVETDIYFADNNLQSLSWWITKHLGYAEREAVILLAEAENGAEPQCALSNKSRKKRQLKAAYTNLPLFWRSFAYFCYRYFFRLGFLDGTEGFLWHFFQGWWYRALVDSKIYETLKSRKH